MDAENKHLKRNRNRKDLSRQKLVVDPPSDFLGASKSIKKKLIIYNNNAATAIDGEELVDIQITLRGKIIGLFFYPLTQSPRIPAYVLQFYRSMKQKHPYSFQMLLVPRPQDPPYYKDPDLFSKLLPHLPFPAVHVDDLDWRVHLSRLCHPRSNPYLRTGMFYIDATHEGVVKSLCNGHSEEVVQYGPHFYPFTSTKLLLVREQFRQLGAKLSIKDILNGDASFLINRHGQRVLVSDLENKDVALYAYFQSHRFDQSEAIRKLELIYHHNNKKNNNFEVVFVNIPFRGGYQDQTSFNNAVSSMPWLALPFDDDRIWNLKHMMFEIQYSAMYTSACWGEFPIMFIKPAGNQSRIDPFGHLVLQEFGPQSYPFTRAKAASMTMDKLKTFTWESFALTARNLGLDFNSLLLSSNNNNEDEDINVKNVPISDIFPNKGRPMLLLFAWTGFLSQGRLKTLIKAYSEARRNSTSPFEVIFVSLYGSNEEIPGPFSGERKIMPWHAVKTPLSFREHTSLLKATIGFNIFKSVSHFMAFQSNGNLLRVGIAKSFDHREFPFVSDVEYEEHVYYCLMKYHGWVWETHDSHLRSTLWDTSVDRDLTKEEDDDVEDDDDEEEEDEDEEDEDEEEDE